MNKKKTLWYALLLFVSGAAFGAVCFHVVFRFHMFESFRGRPPAMADMILRHLTRELDLTQVQQEQLKPIAEEVDRQLNDLRKENKPKVEGVLNFATEKASVILTKPQLEKLTELRKRAVDHFERRPPAPPQ